MIGRYEEKGDQAMGELEIAIRKLECKLEAVKHEASRTSFPHLLKASIDSAATTLNQGVVLSQFGRSEESARNILKSEAVI